jgi:hypothetical protein
LSSCSPSEPFKIVDDAVVKEFNERIANRTDIETTEELIRLFREYSQNEGFRKRSIQTVAIGNGEYRITLIHEGLADDSIFGWKVIMTARQTESTWVVSEIKENWKCREGRGNTNWGTELCL